MATVGINGAAAGKPFPQPVMASKAKTLSNLLPIIILFYSLLLPPEIRFSVAEQSFYPYRIAAIIILPWLISQLGSQHFRFKLADWLVVIAGLWMIVAFVAYYGFSVGFARGLGQAFNVVPIYFIARISITSTDDLRKLLIIAAPGIFVAGLTMLVEAVSHTQIVRPAAASIFGSLPAYEDGVAVGVARKFVDFRFGLLRANGPFPHPILAGLFLVSLLSMYLASGIRSWPLYCGIAAGACSIFSVSSAVLLALLLTIGLTTFDRLNQRIAFSSWRLVLGLVSALLVVVHFASQNGIISIVARYTINPSTARFRTLIWKYGSESVANHPWIGIGFDSYERARWMIASVDAHWLLLAIRYGLLTPICILIASFATVWSLAVTSIQYPEHERKFLVGLAIALALLILSGFTVAYASSAGIWYFMLLAIGVSLSSRKLGAEDRGQGRR